MNVDGSRRTSSKTRRGKITVFAAVEKYEYLTLCVKDWITQVNSGHRDRATQPKNVAVVRAK